MAANVVTNRHILEALLNKQPVGVKPTDEEFPVELRRLIKRWFNLTNKLMEDQKVTNYITSFLRQVRRHWEAGNGRPNRIFTKHHQRFYSKVIHFDDLIEVN